MARDLQITRIKNILTNLFSCKVDMSDAKFMLNSDEYHNVFLSRRIATTAIQIICGVEVDEAVKCIADSHKDYVLMQFIKIKFKKLILLQSKCVKNGIKPIKKASQLSKDDLPFNKNWKRGNTFTKLII